MEQIRIVKEMRDRDERNGRTGVDIRPRYMVWENVPGAFSSNKGEDFRIVLEEIAKVSDKDAVVPMPDNGKWTNCGCIVGDGWSVAWRVLDAQFWGVPQRRRRIALVADFGGHSASEILFVRKSLSGYSDEGNKKRKATASDASRGIGADDRQGEGLDCYNQVLTGDKAKTLNSVATDTDHIPCIIYSVDNHPNDSRVGINEDGMVQALTGRMGTGGGNVPMVMQCYSKQRRAQSSTDFETWKESNTANTLNAFDIGDVRTTEAVVYSVDQGGGKSSVDVREDKAPTLTTTHDDAPAVAYFIGNGQAHDAQKPDKELCKTLNCMDDPMKICIVGTKYIVRRLTPLECERLQGYPDGWTDIGEWTDTNGKKRQTSDAARYKALGNSIALPPWKWVLKRICACYERDATMASLFDGIGGFPYLWEQLNGKGTCLWASEIEEFPIAVTKVRIGE